MTATIHDVPSSHDGATAFTFELRFSENMESFSYTTLHEHALTVTGGSVSNVRRLEAGKNVRWEITVEPDSNADVTIALNVTTDCSAEGAICTGDGRKLSSRVGTHRQRSGRLERVRESRLQDRSPEMKMANAGNRVRVGVLLTLSIFVLLMLVMTTPALR